MPQAADCELFLYADDSCLVYQHRDNKAIETNLNKNFSCVCDWLVDNKLSIHFGEDKTKYILLLLILLLLLLTYFLLTLK